MNTLSILWLKVKSSVTFKGTMCRSEFWKKYILALVAIVLIYMCIYVAGDIISSGCDVFGTSAIGRILNSILLGGVVLFIPIALLLSIYLPIYYISISVRRLRDAGLNPWWVLLGYVPYLGIVVLVLFCLPSKAANSDNLIS